MTERNPNCTLCPLHKQAKTVCMDGVGPHNADILLIGEAPGADEDRTGIPFVGASGELLDELLEYAKLSGYPIQITNAVRCRPPGNKTPSPSQIAKCKQYLDAEIAAVNPRFILVMGNVAMRAVLGITGIRKQRGWIVEKDGRIILPTLHPASVFHDIKNKWLLQKDFVKLRKCIEFGSVPYERKLRPTIVNNTTAHKMLLRALEGVVSADLETTSLYPWDADAAIVSMGFGTLDGEFIFPIKHPESKWRDVRFMIKQITARLKDCIVIGHNSKFDAVWVLKTFGEFWQFDFDTMLADYLLNENRPHDLETVARRLFNAEDWDIPLKEKQGNGPLKRHALYLAHDVFYTRKAYFKLKKQLAHDQQIKQVFDLIMMPCSNLFTRIEHHGVYVDLKQMDRAEEYLLDEANKRKTALQKWGDINWGSTQQLAQLLYKKLRIKCPQLTPKGGPSTSESTLKQIKHPCVADLLKYREARQLHSFFIKGWRPYIHNNRIHPSFKLHGTTTGRLSSNNPNLQQTPRVKMLRSMVSAPSGWVLMEADLSQIELRVIAHLANEPTMMAAFNNNKDIHWTTAIGEIERGAGEKDRVIKTASKLIGKKVNYSDAIDVLIDKGPGAAAAIDPEWDNLRYKAKAVNFGYSFGQWWRGFQNYARDEYDLHLTDEQAQDSRRSFFQLYSKLDDWHLKQQRQAFHHGYVRSMFGRKRRLPEAQEQEDTPARAESWRQAINSPVQSTASDLNLIVLLQMAEEFDWRVFRPIGTIHDAVLAEVRKDYVMRVANRIQEIMQGPKLLEDFLIDFKVPIKGEVKVGNWGTGEKVEQWLKANLV